jgi:hypothetical protein
MDLIEKLKREAAEEQEEQARKLARANDPETSKSAAISVVGQQRSSQLAVLRWSSRASSRIRASAGSSRAGARRSSGTWSEMGHEMGHRKGHRKPYAMPPYLLSAICYLGIRALLILTLSPSSFVVDAGRGGAR